MSYIKRTNDRQLYEDSCAKTCYLAQGNFSRHFHYHAELILSFEGSFDAEVDGKRFRVSEGEGVIAFPYQIHQYFAVDNKRALVMLFNPERNLKFYEYFEDKLPVSPHIPKELISDEMKSLADFIDKHRFYLTGNALDDELNEIYKEAIFALMLEKIELRTVTAGKLDSTRQIMLWCQQHFAEPVTVSIAAKALFVSESQISHLFSGRLHTGFREYINSLRVQSAVELLVSTQKPVSEIALDCGFGSLATFNRAFKLCTVLTPKEVRARGQKILF